MKKLTLLTLVLVGFGLVAGFADDQATWAVTGSGTMTFGVDLDTMAMGFTNAAASELTVTMVGKQSVEKGAEDAVYGYIKLADLTWAVTSAAVTATAPTVTAKIMAAPLWFGIYSAPTIASADKVAIQDSNDTATTVAYTTSGGVAIGYDSDMIDVTAEVASESDWTGAAEDGWAFEVGASVTLDPIALAASFAMGTFGSKDIGFAVKPSLTIAATPLAIKPYVAFDGILAGTGGAFTFEAGAGAEIDLSEDGKTELLVDFSYAEAFGADLKVTATEGADDAGLVPDLSASVAVGVLDLGKTGATMGWSLDVTGAYQLMEDKVKPSLAFGFGSDEIMNLTIQVDLLKMIPNTDFIIKYISADLTGKVAADLGLVTVATTITY